MTDAGGIEVTEEEFQRAQELDVVNRAIREFLTVAFTESARLLADTEAEKRRMWRDLSLKYGLSPDRHRHCQIKRTSDGRVFIEAVPAPRPQETGHEGAAPDRVVADD